ncbi:Two component transcriptional regulator, LuxR family [Desulfosarcina cetonica]|nr:Two component transcriptional regulator, LuxR family [Desulfosarcina cetonica]
MKKRKIFVVEDHPIFRLGISELINQEEDLAVCGGAESVHQAMREIERLNPDLLIVDISLKHSDGIDLIKEIHNQRKDLPMMILSMHDEFLYAERALRAGARGYIMKEEAMESVVFAIRQVLAGNLYFNDQVKEHILFQLSGDSGAADADPIKRLTNRELEVFRLIGRGFSTRDIAGKLNLSIKTIGTYRERIKEKLGLRNATELVRLAVHWENTKKITPSVQA